MTFLAIAAAVFVFVLILALLDSPRRSLSAKERRLERVHESSDAAYFNDLEGSILERIAGPILAKLKRERSKRLSVKKEPAKKSGDAKLEKQLNAAGLLISARGFSFLKLGIAVTVIAITFLIVWGTALEDMLKLLIISGAGMIAMLAPTYVLRFLANSRQDSMKKQLPDLLDILSVSIDAGLGFDSALKRALPRFRGALKEELTVASMEIAMGKPRRDALTDMANRCDIKELRIMTAALVQSEQMGTPLKNVLKTQSAQLRLERKRVAQEKGMKAPVKMMLPMVGIIFPVLLIILMGPTVLNIVNGL